MTNRGGKATLIKALLTDRTHCIVLALLKQFTTLRDAY